MENSPEFPQDPNKPTLPKTHLSSRRGFLRGLAGAIGALTGGKGHSQEVPASFPQTAHAKETNQDDISIDDFFPAEGSHTPSPTPGETQTPLPLPPESPSPTATSAAQPSETPSFKETGATPEALAVSETSYGFNTHLYAQPEGEQDISLDVFKEDIDRLAREGQKIVRFSIRPWEAAPAGSPTSIQWNEQNLSVYDAAIAYAKEKNLDVFLVIGPPDFAKDEATFPPDIYAATMREYTRAIVERNKEKLAIVQLFNEADIHHYRDYSLFGHDNKPLRTPEYLDELSFIAGEVAKAVKEVNPDIKVTMNAGGWPLNDDRVNNWIEYFDAVAEHCDFISLDMYPDDNEYTIGRLPGWIELFRSRYGKDVCVAELGLPTAKFSEADQGKYLSMAIESLEEAHVAGIIPYMLRDVPKFGGNEASFGILRADGSEKESYNTVMEAMHPDEDDATPVTEQETPTPSPTY